MEHAEAILDVVTILAFAALLFGVPILISRLLLRASWRAIGRAYAIWFGFLLVISVLGDERAGWALILAIFFTIPVVPIVILLLKLASALLKITRRIQNSRPQSTPPK